MRLLLFMVLVTVFLVALSTAAICRDPNETMDCANRCEPTCGGSSVNPPFFFWNSELYRNATRKKIVLVGAATVTGSSFVMMVNASELTNVHESVVNKVLLHNCASFVTLRTFNCLLEVSGRRYRKCIRYLWNRSAVHVVSVLSLFTAVSHCFPLTCAVYDGYTTPQNNRGTVTATLTAVTHHSLNSWPLALEKSQARVKKSNTLL